jgi:hypothetical protein
MDKKSIRKFYYVAADDSYSSIGYRHTTLKSAYLEAVRLSKKENKTFYVLMTIVKIVPDVTIKEVTDARPDDFMPFVSRKPE